MVHWLLLAGSLGASVAFAQQTPLEVHQEEWAIQRVEAGFISLFPFYVTWPDGTFQDHPDKIYFGFLGHDTLGEAGRQYLSEHGHLGQDYVLEQVPSHYTADTLSRYQMLYIGGLPRTEMKKLLKKIDKKPILTMSHELGFLQNGGIIQLTTTLDAVTWQVSLSNAKNAGLEIDPRLATYGKVMTQPWREPEAGGTGEASG